MFSILNIFSNSTYTKMFSILKYGLKLVTMLSMFDLNKGNFSFYHYINFRQLRLSLSWTLYKRLPSVNVIHSLGSSALNPASLISGTFDKLNQQCLVFYFIRTFVSSYTCLFVFYPLSYFVQFKNPTSILCFSIGIT